MSTHLMLAENVTIYKANPDEIRIRKGIWNHEEAILALDTLSPAFREVMLEVLGKLDAGESIDPEEYLKERIPDADSQTMFSDAINSLKAQKYLISDEESKAAALLSDLLGGVFSNRYSYVADEFQPVLFITDLASTSKYIELLAKDIGLPVTIVMERELEQFVNADLTTRFEGLSTIHQQNELSQFLSPYRCITMALANPRISLLRNINRIAVAESIMLSMALLDGPFLTAMTFKPTETGCFECFENRILARLQEISVYREFSKKFSLNGKTDREYSHVSPLINTFASIPIFEAFMYSCIGKTTLAGRVLNVYLPALEIQVQDLLRIPSCPACGFVSQAKMEDMYASSSQIVENLVNKILIKE